MKLASLRDGSADGRLVVVSSDLRRAVSAAGIADSLLSAIESWDLCEPRLSALGAALDRGAADGVFDLPTGGFCPPPPRPRQRVGASGFFNPRGPLGPGIRRA